MIFYFTGTGNSLYAARQLSENPISIPKAIHQESLTFTGDQIGIVTPVYGHEVPSMVKEFLKKAEFHTNYTPIRTAQVAVNLLLFLSVLGTMVSAIILSREVFAFLPISGGIAMARRLHIFSVFWSFTLMALHLGLHWNRILGMIRKASGPIQSRPLKLALRLGGAAVAVYGLYAFVKNQFPSYMFLTTTFVFFDFERPLPLFFAEYLAIMGLFVFLAHYGSKGLHKLPGKRRGTITHEK